MTRRGFTARNTSVLALLERVEDVPDSVKALLKMSRNGFEMFDSIQKQLVAALQEDNRMICERVERLMIHTRSWSSRTALTWVLEIGEVSRFQFVRARSSATAGYAAASTNQQAKNSGGQSPRSGTNTCKPN